MEDALFKPPSKNANFTANPDPPPTPPSTVLDDDFNAFRLASYFAVMQFRIRIRIHRIHLFLSLLDPDPDPLVRGMDPDPGPDPSIIKQK